MKKITVWIVAAVLLLTAVVLWVFLPRTSTFELKGYQLSNEQIVKPIVLHLELKTTTTLEGIEYDLSAAFPEEDTAGLPMRIQWVYLEPNSDLVSPDYMTFNWYGFNPSEKESYSGMIALDPEKGLCFITQFPGYENYVVASANGASLQEIRQHFADFLRFYESGWKPVTPSPAPSTSPQNSE